MLTVTPLAAFDDNYIWIIHCDPTKVVVVDPGDGQVVLDWLKHTGLTPKAILITHRHHDHTGGVADIVAQYPIPVYGPDSPRVPCVTHRLYQGDSLELFDEHSVSVIETPGHTMDHICYHIESTDRQSNQLFCGDTLFSVGCGRIFDGTAALLYQSISSLKLLPDNTWLYGTHEYTRDNVRFALAVEPNNSKLQAYSEGIKNKNITLPTTLKDQLEINPFLRVDKPAIKESVSRICRQTLQNESETFVALRAWKDKF